MNAIKDETSRLVLPTNSGYDDIDKNDDVGRQINRWKTLPFVSIALLVGYAIFVNQPKNVPAPSLSSSREERKCHFCDQSPPTIHLDKSYTIEAVGLANEDIVVIPMTVTYDYELYDGQSFFTNPATEHIPNLEFDYAVLGMAGARNINRETGESVSLDEVYMHHFVISPFNQLGAEVLTRDDKMPYMRYPDGYASYVIADEHPCINIGAHLLSNKHLAPIGGSIARAHKECNECYYAPGKGSDCTPEVSGTFDCCGDSLACLEGGEECACATNGGTDRSKTTKYQIQIDLLISRDIDKFKRVDQWNFAAPSCAVNLSGEGVFEKYPRDNYCFNKTEGGSKFHQIAEDDVNPYVKTKIDVLAPAGGTIVWAQGHLHTGGVNATLRINGEVICSSGAVYGTDSNEAANARNEQNHLIQIEPCYDQIGHGIRFEEGDVFTTESFYYAGTDDKRFVGMGAAGEHKNVMSMLFLGVVFDEDSEYLMKKRTSSNRGN